MSNADDLLTVKNELEAIASSDVMAPTMPTGIFVQEAEDLAQWSTTDLVLLATLGIDAAKLEALKVGSGALRQAQSLWVKDRLSMLDAQKQWASQSPAAFDLRDELIHNFRYAFRMDDKLLGRFSEIADGTGNADMIQDLNDLSVLGKENLELLAAVSFDAAKLDTAATLSDTLSEILAVANGDKLGENEGKVLRDRAFTYLKMMVDEVRNAGKYLFWKNPERLKGYHSEYWRKINANKPKKEELVENPE